MNYLITFKNIVLLFLSALWCDKTEIRHFLSQSYCCRSSKILLGSTKPHCMVVDVFCLSALDALNCFEIFLSLFATWFIFII